MRLYNNRLFDSMFFRIKKPVNRWFIDLSGIALFRRNDRSLFFAEWWKLALISHRQLDQLNNKARKQHTCRVSRDWYGFLTNDNPGRDPPEERRLIMEYAWSIGDIRN